MKYRCNSESVESVHGCKNKVFLIVKSKIHMTKNLENSNVLWNTATDPSQLEEI